MPKKKAAKPKHMMTAMPPKSMPMKPLKKMGGGKMKHSNKGGY